MVDYSQGPVRRGDAYCSPWCGFGCKHVAFEQATKEAAALAAKMGDGWEPDVWESGGWHYRVRKGCVKISVQIRGSCLNSGWTVEGYTAWIESESEGHTMIQFIESAADPENALGFATQKARTHMARLSDALAEVLS